MAWGRGLPEIPFLTIKGEKSSQAGIIKELLRFTLFPAAVADLSFLKCMLSLAGDT